ncbi:hypothetical protein [Companilactobacillus sp. DQM5]|uniref:hypothetical protein n=1 Tax=Companilactobacillus sp. DQM5 TaxID=3463359 RepID=UPI0040588BFE
MMIKNLKMSITQDLINFVDKFATYDLVFNEYMETMKKISDGKALMFENFQTLNCNYRKNVQLFTSETIKTIKILQKKIDSTSLNEIIKSLNDYISELNKVTNCVDENSQSLDLIKHKLIVANVQNAKNNLFNSLQMISSR